jgi:hypothetical protein
MLCSPVLAVGFALVSTVAYASPLGSPRGVDGLRRNVVAHKTFRNLVVFGDSFSDSGKSFSLSSAHFPFKLSLTKFRHEQGTRTVSQTIHGLLIQRTTRDGFQTGLCGWNILLKSSDWDCIIMHLVEVSHSIEFKT